MMTVWKCCMSVDVIQVNRCRQLLKVIPSHHPKTFSHHVELAF